MLLLLSAIAQADSLEFTEAPRWEAVYRGARITRLASYALLPAGAVLAGSVEGSWPLVMMGVAGGGIIVATPVETGALYGKADSRPSMMPMLYGLVAMSYGAAAINNEQFDLIDGADPVEAGSFVLGTGVLAFGVVQPVVNRYSFQEWQVTVGRVDGEATGLVVSGRF